MSPNERTPSWEGQSFPELEPSQRGEVLTAAVDYRGDVTLHLEGGESLSGYLYSRDRDASGPVLRLLPADGGDRRSLPEARLVGLDFSGPDKAFGRSWEHWVKRFEQAKGELAAGRQPGSYEPEVESLD